MGGGDPEVRALWRDIRDWAVEGQNETLARLGVVFDVEISEAETFPRIRSFVEHALAQGAMTHAENGALVYLTGDEDYPVFPLARPDGFPTQNLRTLTLWYELMQKLEGYEEVINVVGEEWRAHTIYVQEILRRMGMEQRVLPTVDVVHGMITATEGGEGEMSSSAGDVVLVDDLLDELAASDALQELAIPDRAGLLGRGPRGDGGAGVLPQPAAEQDDGVERREDPRPEGGRGCCSRARGRRRGSRPPTARRSRGPTRAPTASRSCTASCSRTCSPAGWSAVDLLAVLRSVTHMAKWYARDRQLAERRPRDALAARPRPARAGRAVGAGGVRGRRADRLVAPLGGATA